MKINVFYFFSWDFFFDLCYQHVWVCTCECVCVQVCVYMCVVYLWMCMCASVYVHVCSVHVNVCVQVCMYMCVCVCVFTCTWSLETNIKSFPLSLFPFSTDADPRSCQYGESSWQACSWGPLSVLPKCWVRGGCCALSVCVGAGVSTHASGLPGQSLYPLSQLPPLISVLSVLLRHCPSFLPFLWQNTISESNLGSKGFISPSDTIRHEGG